MTGQPATQLIVHRPSGDKSVPVTGTITIGRQPGNALVLTEELKCSRHHARILWEGQDLVFEDLKSANGSLVNGQRVERAVLQEGDRIQIGEQVLSVQGLVPASAAEPPTPPQAPSPSPAPAAAPQQPSATPPAQPAARSGPAPSAKKHGCFFYGCLGALLLGLLGLGLVVLLFAFAGSELEPVADAYLAALEEEDYTKAFALLGPEAQATVTAEQYAMVQHGLRQTFGPLKDKSLEGVEMTARNGRTLAQLRYSATFARGPAELHFVLEKQGEAYIIQGYHYKSPLLE